MKKLFVAIAMIFVSLFAFAGCGSDESGWVEVQSITYTDNTSTNIIKSEYKVNYKMEETTLEEYESATEDQKKDVLKLVDSLPGLKELSVTKNELFDLNNRYINKSYYYNDVYDALVGDYQYYKFTFTDIEVHYVKVKFLDDGSIELNYYESINNLGYTTIRVKPLTYAITYFTN